jgi:hypothetical protein
MYIHLFALSKINARVKAKISHVKIGKLNLLEVINASKKARQ